MAAALGQPGALLERALDPAVDAPPDDALSERVLDAALALSAASGVRHMTMDDVAHRAGVGRMTVYRRFGDKARLVESANRALVGFVPIPRGLRKPHASSFLPLWSWVARREKGRPASDAPAPA